MALWGQMLPGLDEAQKRALILEATKAFEGSGLVEIRGDREKLAARAASSIQAGLSRNGWQSSPVEIETMAREVVAQVVGLGFLEPLLRLDAGYTEIGLNPSGDVWAIPRGEQDPLILPAKPTETEVWRAVEALLTPLGKSISEASPSVDAKIPRTPDLPGGARLKILHPVIVPGKGRFPSINIRLFQPEPVHPEKLVEWQVAPAWVIEGLLLSVAAGLRILVLGGTASGKTTMLSALCNGIPKTSRVVKIEDPEEIWLDIPNQVTIEARSWTVGSTVPAYTLANGVDDAMRMSPRWLIVGEMRRGDAINALFRAQMSDHPGLSTFHAESPEAAVKRMTTMLWADMGIQTAAAKELIAEAVDMVVQVGFRDVEEIVEGENITRRRRRLVGIWAVEKQMKGGDLKFRPLYTLEGEEKSSRDIAINQFEEISRVNAPSHAILEASL